MRLQKIVLPALIMAGFALRLHYLTTTHPFFDEYTTVLAAREILRRGWPVLPSGLFYEHGLLATYVIAPFTALFINTPSARWQAAQWGLMPARWPSLLLGTATIPLIFAVGRRTLPARHSTGPAVLAAGLFALSPEGMVWGGRARMYALATLLVLLVVYWAYRGIRPNAPARHRHWALLALAAALLTQFGVLMLVPPLLVAMAGVGWLVAASARPARKPWFLRRAALLEGLALAAVVGLAIWVKRLGRPLGAAALGAPASDGLPAELIRTVAYQTTIHFTWPDTLKFLARQFGVPHHFWLSILALAAAVIGLAIWLFAPGHSPARSANGRSTTGRQISGFYLFLWLIFGLIILEMVSLLEPFRRNPRYLVMYLPLFYLIAANALFNLWHLFWRALPARQPAFLPVAAAAGMLILFTAAGFNDTRIALKTPEPAYEQAFAWIKANWQPGDTLLTMNTPAAGLYLGRADGFTVQNDAGQFLLETGARRVDRWMGVPWLGAAADFNAALNAGKRAWFVIDTIRRPVYFRGDWLAVVNSQMEPVWSGDNAIVYLTREDRIPIPTRPGVQVNATLGQAVRLTGYTLQPVDPPSSAAALYLTLFWQPLSPLADNYTVFVHLRNPNGATVAQSDRQPLDGAYPTARWQPGETVIDPLTLPLPANLPAGSYRLFTGMYRLDTLERLPVANDTSGENAILLGEVTLP